MAEPASAAPAQVRQHRVADLARLFDAEFGESHNTRLVAGADEPLYVPSPGDAQAATIFSRADYFPSALHEIAHWCIAGCERRALRDYGYWYQPDGRDRVQQREFERVEARPQALECLFSLAAAYRFRLSSDNLHGARGDRRRFAAAVRRELVQLCQRMPPRAAQFRRALCRHYGTPWALPNGAVIAGLAL